MPTLAQRGLNSKVQTDRNSGIGARCPTMAYPANKQRIDSPINSARPATQRKHSPKLTIKTILRLGRNSSDRGVSLICLRSPPKDLGGLLLRRSNSRAVRRYYSIPGTGNDRQNSAISCLTRPSTAVSSGARSTSRIQLPTVFISASFIPRVVSAAVPIRIPLGSRGLRGS